MSVPEHRLNIFMVAGESSGDQLGAELMRALSKKTGNKIHYSGIGGPLMQAEGLDIFFPSSDIAMMGLPAVLANFSLLLSRLRETVRVIVSRKPDLLLVIDSPEFTQRVAKRVRKAASSIPIVKYVAPQVWAWRPKRALKMRGYIDEILALLPFEPACYRQLQGPNTTYVGHPLVARSDLYAPRQEGEGAPILAVLPGSRASEVKRHMKCFGETLEFLAKSCEFHAVIPVVPHLRDLIVQESNRWSVRPVLIEGQDEKWALFRKARAALAASGTVTLELALAQVPQVVVYRMEPVMAFVIRRLIRVKSAVLPNLILGENVVPEFYQKDVRGDILAPLLMRLLHDGKERERQLGAFRKLYGLMELDGDKEPAAMAAERVLANMNYSEKL